MDRSSGHCRASDGTRVRIPHSNRDRERARVVRPILSNRTPNEPPHPADGWRTSATLSHLRGRGSGTLGGMTGDPHERARDLRRDSSVPERILWKHLRARRLAGHKFKRQVPLGPFVADFLCADAKLVIEIDGRDHDQRGARDRSARSVDAIKRPASRESLRERIDQRRRRCSRKNPSRTQSHHLIEQLQPLPRPAVGEVGLRAQATNRVRGPARVARPTSRERTPIEPPHPADGSRTSATLSHLRGRGSGRRTLSG